MAVDKSSYTLPPSGLSAMPNAVPQRDNSSSSH